MPCGMLTSARCHPGGRPVLTSARCHPGGRPVLTSAWPMLMSALTGKRVNGPGAHRLVSGSHQQEVPTCQCCVSEKRKRKRVSGPPCWTGPPPGLGPPGPIRPISSLLIFFFLLLLTYRPHVSAVLPPLATGPHVSASAGFCAASLGSGAAQAVTP